MKCFYHSDIDGRCAGAIVARFTNNYNKDNYIEYDYSKPLPTEIIQEGETVYFVDLSFSVNTVDKLQEILDKKCNLVWCDHHTSTMDVIAKNLRLNAIPGLRMEGISGAALTWMYFAKCSYDEIPHFIKLISDFDCWIFKEKATKQFKFAIEARDYSVLSPLWNALVRDEINDNREFLNQMVAEGEIIRKYVKREYKEYLEKYAYESKIQDIKCLVINRRVNSMIFGDDLDEYPIYVTWAYDGDKYRYSIYSEKEDIDCSEIAETFGGGGHKGAAGFVSEFQILDKINV